jgi:UrcA family protein
MKRVLFTAATILVLGAGAALAEDAAQARVIPVQYADLDLSRTEDAAALLSRLRYATTRACEAELVTQPSSAERRAFRTCRDGALARAVAALGAPELTRLYTELTARPQGVASR